jgi:hypothetical protein
MWLPLGAPAFGRNRERHRVAGGKRGLQRLVEQDLEVIFECHGTAP